MKEAAYYSWKRRVVEEVAHQAADDFVMAVCKALDEEHHEFRLRMRVRAARSMYCRRIEEAQSLRLAHQAPVRDPQLRVVGGLDIAS